MSLLQSEEFAIYRLRTSYLANVHDGVGERLINIDTSFLNDPAYKAAGWSANPPELKRCYSPPIPTKIAADYFRAPANLQSRRDAETDLPEDDEEGGMITGVASNDTTAPTTGARRRRRREQLEEDDSSGLSDESEESDEDVEGEERRPANQIRFAKMPSRDRDAESSPLRTSISADEQGPDVMVTSPSKPSNFSRPRRGSLGAVEALKQRERRDTATSSEISSENELDPSLFRRRRVQASSGARSATLTQHMRQHDEEDHPSRPDPETERHSIEEVESASDDSSLASGFSDGEGAAMFLSGSIGDFDSPEVTRRSAPASSAARQTASPEGEKSMLEALPELPPARPISTIIPKSALAAAIKASNQKPSNPFERFATLSGQGEPNPLYIKIYLPPECQAEKPLELLLRRNATTGGPVTVAEALGYSLWRYGEDGMTPPIPKEKMNVNWWTMRIVEGEEVDFDFPPLSRQRPISDFTSTNNRPPRARIQGKPWDDFALVEATEAQFAENNKATPIYSQEAAAINEQQTSPSPTRRPQPARRPSASDLTAHRLAQLRRNPVTDPMFLNTALRKDSAVPAADVPLIATSTSHAPRSGANKTLNIHFTDNNFTPHIVPIPVTTDTYIAEVFDAVCTRLHIDKALYVLKVSHTTTVAPVDRTVEALGSARQSLDLVRRRFVGADAYSFTGSPSSTSPNAPLLVSAAGTVEPRRRTARRRDFRDGTAAPVELAHIDPSQAEADAGIIALNNPALNTSYKRYNVIRKQPMSFAPSSQRVLALEGEYMHVMPADTGRERLTDSRGGGAGKTTTVHMSGVVGTKVNRKHPKTFRVIVFRGAAAGGIGYNGTAGAAGAGPGREGTRGGQHKRYDFEAGSAEEAMEIVEEIKRGMRPYAL